MIESESACEDNTNTLSNKVDINKTTSTTNITNTPRRWKNKQRTLVFCSRGITHRFRHFLDDLRKLLPHHRTESKWEKNQSLRDINELCEMKLCNNCIFLETRKLKELYMWVSRTPNGPSIKFQVLNRQVLFYY
eukprot:GHVR01143120.1.p1 GENE.GHVR01143120.1~~GHVR01143120.1.p1  ORF type:complete len:134 (-),score=24.12 GHVR01143120.1:505-906(-)